MGGGGGGGKRVYAHTHLLASRSMYVSAVAHVYDRDSDTHKTNWYFLRLEERILNIVGINL